MHARIAILEGLSPKENRSVPPLNYERVFKLKSDFPELDIVLKGGLRSVADVERVLPRVDGVMVGREAYHNPWILVELDQWLGRINSVPDRLDIVTDLAWFGMNPVWVPKSLTILQVLLGLGGTFGSIFFFLDSRKSESPT